jgi:hypothetical protein
VIARRFEAATGNQAILVETGETLEALAGRRALLVKRAADATAGVRGSNPLSSTIQSGQTAVVSGL